MQWEVLKNKVRLNYQKAYKNRIKIPIISSGSKPTIKVKVISLRLFKKPKNG